MKRYFIIISLFYIFNTSFAQSTQPMPTSSDVGKIALSVIMPENVDGLDASQLSKLETKIIQIVSASGLAATGYNNNFVIYPKFAIYETNDVEGGMQTITVVTTELSLFIKQVDNNVLFASMSKQLKGSGNNKQTAITNSISKISTNDEDFKTFIASGKQKIIQYYESNCSDIISKSDALVKMQKYEDAMGLLMTVPEEISDCYSKVQDKAIEAFKAYQNQQCAKQMEQANIALAANNYNGALDILGQIDPSASCFNESQTLMKNAATKVDAEEKKQWDFKMKQYNDDVAMEKQRVNAIKDIAVAYYKSQPTTVNYSYIVY
jgi:hypothetical protein